GTVRLSTLTMVNVISPALANVVGAESTATPCSDTARTPHRSGGAALAPHRARRTGGLRPQLCPRRAAAAATGRAMPRQPAPQALRCRWDCAPSDMARPRRIAAEHPTALASLGQRLRTPIGTQGTTPRRQ